MHTHTYTESVACRVQFTIYSIHTYDDITAHCWTTENCMNERKSKKMGRKKRGSNKNVSEFVQWNGPECAAVGKRERSLPVTFTWFSVPLFIQFHRPTRPCLFQLKLMYECCWTYLVTLATATYNNGTQNLTHCIAELIGNTRHNVVVVVQISLWFMRENVYCNKHWLSIEDDDSQRPETNENERNKNNHRRHDFNCFTEHIMTEVCVSIA